MATGGKGVLGFIGFWAVIIGFILASVAGLVTALGGNEAIIVVPVILGIIIGFLSVAERSLSSSC